MVHPSFKSVSEEIKNLVTKRLDKEFSCHYEISDNSDLKKLLKKSDALFLEVCKKFCSSTQNVVDQQTVSVELLTALIERYPDTMMCLKQRVDEQLHNQMDWITLHYDSLQEKIDRAGTVEEAREVHLSMTKHFEEVQSKESLIQHAKHFFATKIKGEWTDKPQELFNTIEHVCKRMFLTRIRMSLIPGEQLEHDPMLLVCVPWITLETQFRNLEEQILSQISDKATDSSPGIKKVQISQTIASQAVHLSLMGFNTIGEVLSHIEQGHQREIAEKIGTFTYRFDMFRALSEKLKPIKVHNVSTAMSALTRVGYALLPEVLDESSWEEYKTDLLEFSYILSNLDHEKPEYKDCKLEATMSLELLAIICLPLVGFSGQPLTYNPIFDLERSVTRELATRILKSIDKQRAGNNLLLFEQAVQFGKSEILTKEITPLHEHCQQVKCEVPDSKVQLTDLLVKGVQCWLEQINTPEEGVCNRHAVICVTGFLSEATDMKNYNWPHLTNYCRARNIPLYVLRWESKNKSDIYQLMLKQADQNDIINMISQSNKISDLISAKNISAAFKFSKELALATKEVFCSTRQTARMSGKMLAHYLASAFYENDMLKGQTVSLIGFSLGSQVIKSCLNRLYKIRKFDLVHNVYLLAGATDFLREKFQLEVFSKVVSGRIVHTYADADKAMDLFKYAVKREGIGKLPQFVKADLGEVRFDNYDLENIVESHFDYRPKMSLILDHIEFQA